MVLLYLAWVVYLQLIWGCYLENALKARQIIDISTEVITLWYPFMCPCHVPKQTLMKTNEHIIKQIKIKGQGTVINNLPN